MKTTIDIPEKELRDAMRFTKAKTKKEAILAVLADYNRRQRMAELIKYSGTFDSLMTNEEIEALDEERTRRIWKTQ
ncbi:MAG TPA: type II toxin-antitoxin system VapB family antitoxin [Chthoniobacterales bacterium]